ncbi:MAG TPA: hypothetical protein PLH57_01075, partial [Oligoflexia bacterium]|nr:hypothetical protein [Oligoflexia bacterium]
GSASPIESRGALVQYFKSKNFVGVIFGLWTALVTTGCPFLSNVTAPQAKIEQLRGRAILTLSDSVPVKRVQVFELNGSPEKRGALVWSAESLISEGQFLPGSSDVPVDPNANLSGFFNIGLPASDCEPSIPGECHPKRFWDYTEINIQDVLLDQHRYQVEIEFSVTDEPTKVTFTHRAREDVFQFNWPETLKTRDYGVISDRWAPWRFVETPSGNYVFAALRNSEHPDRPLGYTALDSQHVRNVIPLKPLTPEFFGVYSEDPATRNITGPMSRPIILENGRPVVAVMSNDHRSNYGMRLNVYKGKPPASVSSTTTAVLENEWTAIGSIETVYDGWATISTPALVLGRIAGLADQHDTSPLIVSGQDPASTSLDPKNPQAFDLWYFAKNETWKSLGTAGIIDSGSPIMAIDLAITKKGTLYGCVQYALNAIHVMKYSPNERRWNTLVSTHAGFGRLDSEHSRVCQLAVEGDTLTAVGYLASPRYTLWVQKISEGGEVRTITPDLAAIIKSKPSWYIQEVDQPVASQTARVHHTRLIQGDLYIALDDFGGLFPLSDYWPYSRSVHLIKFNGTEWVRVRSSEFPLLPDMPPPSPGSAPQNDRTATIGAFITKHGDSLLYSGARWISPADPQIAEFQSIMTWELR